MIKADASKTIRESDTVTIKGCEVSITGEYGQIMGEYKAITTAFINTVLQKAPKEYKYEIANDIVGVLESGATRVAEFIKEEIDA